VYACRPRPPLWAGSPCGHTGRASFGSHTGAGGPGPTRADTPARAGALDGGGMLHAPLPWLHLLLPWRQCYVACLMLLLLLLLLPACARAVPGHSPPCVHTRACALPAPPQALLRASKQQQKQPNGGGPAALGADSTSHLVTSGSMRSGLQSRQSARPESQGDSSASGGCAAFDGPPLPAACMQSTAKFVRPQPSYSGWMLLRARLCVSQHAHARRAG